MDKRGSNAAKGIGIMLMLFHHLFFKVSNTARYAEGHVVSYAPIGQDAVVRLAQLGKVCVCVFVFVTAYGTYRQVVSKPEKLEGGAYSVSHYVKLIANFMPIYVMCFAAGLISGYKSPHDVYWSGGKLQGCYYALVDMLGLSRALGTPSLNPTWWYLSLATLFIFALPPLCLWAQKKGSVLVLVLAVLVPQLSGLGLGGSMLRYLPTAGCGMVFAQYRVFERVRDAIPMHAVRIVMALIACAAMVFCRLRIGESVAILEMFLATAICGLGSELATFKPLEVLGQHSSNMFMFHTFLYNFYLRDLLFSCGSWALITAALIVSSLLISVVLEAVKHLLGYDDKANRAASWVAGLLDAGVPAALEKPTGRHHA